ncbi:hypothetical protein [Amycolatopsis eburnea]|uniref:Uncharacterized protein n=1 Tax=Amycolatopsis eburnea TaxID=2267691 RepID=A0A3R9KUF3_9PSEU|nr:hypothetical protein [Amycolatopsis eburnea]RSD26446.1 hypothetical protein EIY87_00225 [Amycolatopsis eburnea]
MSELGPISRAATTWTAVFVVAATNECVTVGSWDSPDALTRWARDPWFRGRARFEGMAPLIHPTDFTAELQKGTR